MTISSLFLFLLASEVKFHSTNIKKISMVSIYSLKQVYTFLYTIVNDNVLASFVQKKKKGFEIWRSKKQSFLLTYATLKPPHPLYAIVRIWVDPSPSPLCVRTMWINNKNKKFINLSQNQKVFLSKTGQLVNMSFKH